jgi:DNA modification methylase
MTELAVTYRKTAELVPYERNARTHTQAQIEQIAAAIRQFGWTNPVLVDERGGIIAGHGRVAAATGLGMAEVPTICIAGLSDAQRRALILADNKLALNAGWDEALLASELHTLRAEDFDLGVIGFGADELNRLLPNGGGLTDPDDAPPLPVDPVSVLGDVWVLGAHRIVCGDSTDSLVVDKVLAGVKPHLMVTDPPYGVEYDPKWRAKAGINKSKTKMGEVLNDNVADWREAWARFPGAVAYVWHAGRYASTVQASLEAAGFEIRSQIIWAKDRFALSRGHYHWQHEPCWYAARGTAQWCGDRSQSTLWSIRARDDSGIGHGTQKPVECMRRPIENNSSVGQAVYEPFCGSGTTIIAAEMTGRVCHAIELNPAYVDVSLKRWQDFTGKLATHEETGLTFGVLAERRRQPVAA